MLAVFGAVALFRLKKTKTNNPKLLYKHTIKSDSISSLVKFWDLLQRKTPTGKCQLGILFRLPSAEFRPDTTLS